LNAAQLKPNGINWQFYENIIIKMEKTDNVAKQAI
jgi:hypothetical protein